MLKTFFGERAEPAPSRLRDLLDAADKTQPGSNIRKMPLDHLHAAIGNANNRVVAASATLMQAEEAYKQACEQHDAYIQACAEKLAEAEHVRRRAQQALCKELKHGQVFEGIEDIAAFVRECDSVQASE